MTSLILWFFGCLVLRAESQYSQQYHGMVPSLAPPFLNEETSTEAGAQGHIRKTINLALTPIENDLLGMNIKYGGEDNYNIHELPQNDGIRSKVKSKDELSL